jgi:RNA polymerase sigma-70 factor, ECF subfamily
VTDTIEQRIEERHASGDLRGAATAALEGYGPEVFGFLVASLRSETDAADVFSQLSEDLWRGLPAFEWRSSFRTWLYRLARNAMARHLRAPARRAKHRVPLSQVSEVAERVRTETSPHLRTQVKDAFARVRDSLGEDDRMLLILRVDRRLPWNDVAKILAESDLGGAALDREAGRLRKRFQTLKEEIAAALAQSKDDER